MKMEKWGKVENVKNWNVDKMYIVKSKKCSKYLKKKMKIWKCEKWKIGKIKLAVSNICCYTISISKVFLKN